MKVIHLGTQVVCQLALLDDDGNVTNNINIAPSQQNPEDPLFIRSLKQEAFAIAFQKIMEKKAQIEMEVAEPPAPPAEG